MCCVVQVLVRCTKRTLHVQSIVQILGAVKLLERRAFAASIWFRWYAFYDSRWLWPLFWLWFCLLVWFRFLSLLDFDSGRCLVPILVVAWFQLRQPFRFWAASSFRLWQLSDIDCGIDIKFCPKPNSLLNLVNSPACARPRIRFAWIAITIYL